MIINRLPINATKWDRMDKFTQFHVLNRKTVRKYIYLLAEYVAIKIKDDLKSVDMVNFVIDGWTSGSHHIIGLFGYYEIDNDKKFPLFLLSLSPLKKSLIKQLKTIKISCTQHWNIMVLESSCLNFLLLITVAPCRNWQGLLVL